MKKIQILKELNILVNYYSMEYEQQKSSKGVSPLLIMDFGCHLLNGDPSTLTTATY